MINSIKGSFKDMNYLNRDPRRTVIVDFEKDSYLNTNNNLIKIS